MIQVVVEPVAVEIELAAEMLGMSRSHFDKHVRHHLRTVRSGRLRLVPVAELKAWVEKHASTAVADLA